MRLCLPLLALLVLSPSAAGAIDELSLISDELTASSGPNHAVCPPGVNLKELLADLEETPHWADLWLGTAAMHLRGITSVALYQSCRAEALRDAAPCDALDLSPVDLLSVFKFNRAPELVAKQAGNHCRLNLTLQARLSGSKDYLPFCLRSWQVAPEALDLVCDSVRRHFPSPSATCAAILAEAPALGSVATCRSSMAGFFGEPGACERISSPFGDRETCYWVREARQSGFNAETCRTRGCAALSGRRSACRAYVSPTVARLCSPPAGVSSLLRRVVSQGAPTARARALEDVLRSLSVPKPR